MTIFLDMDMVLADFNGHTNNLGIPFNKQWGTPREQWTVDTWNGEIIKNAAMILNGFWIGIPLMPDAQKLWDFAQDYDCHVCTSLPFIGHSIPKGLETRVIHEEKFGWIEKNLGKFDESKFIVVGKEGKGTYCRGPGDILIDDDTRNGDAWIAAGGHFVHYKSADQAIEDTKAIINVKE